MHNDLVNIVAEFVGNHTIFKQQLDNTILMLIERARLMERNRRHRKRKHVGEGILMAVRILCFELGLAWGVAAAAK